jgi:hypothetical protein
MEPALHSPWYLKTEHRTEGLFFNPSVPFFLAIARGRDGFDANQQVDYRAQREFSCQGEKNNEKGPLKQPNEPVSTFGDRSDRAPAQGYSPGEDDGNLMMVYADLA